MDYTVLREDATKQNCLSNYQPQQLRTYNVTIYTTTYLQKDRKPENLHSQKLNRSEAKMERYLKSFISYVTSAVFEDCK